MNGYSNSEPAIDLMKKLINRLTSLLEEENELLEALLSVLLDEKNGLVYAQLNKLNEACKAKENLILKIRILEEQRLHVLHEFSKVSGCSLENITLEKLSELAGEVDSTRLIECRSSLLSLTKSIGDLNNSNRSLLNYSMGLVRTSLSFLDNFTSQEPLYYRDGRLCTIDRSGRFFSTHN
ncbi:MAG: flagellar export chaperone FlgN [Desulfosarcina sp.]|nr:flagellar export chaperone FlgN [Desulfobacterales bacterium]